MPETEELERKIKELQAEIESDRSHIADCVRELDEALDMRFWLSEGRGSYSWDDDRFRQEFHDAAIALMDRIKPIRALARKFDHCPATQADVIAARTQMEQAIRADERKHVAISLERMDYQGIYEWIKSTASKQKGEVTQAFPRKRKVLVLDFDEANVATEFALCPTATVGDVEGVCVAGIHTGRSKMVNGTVEEREV